MTQPLDVDGVRIDIDIAEIVGCRLIKRPDGKWKVIGEGPPVRNVEVRGDAGSTIWGPPIAPELARALAGRPKRKSKPAKTRKSK